MNPVRITLILALFVVCMLLAAGCSWNNSHQENKTSSIIQTTPYPWYTVTSTELNSSHPELIKMDADIYNIGEVIEVNLVSRYIQVDNCTVVPCSYCVAYQLENGSWYILPEPVEPMDTTVEGPRPHSSCESIHFATTNWSPGRYRIQFYCGVSREFILREVPKLSHDS
jgi:hypothetical protein